MKSFIYFASFCVLISCGKQGPSNLNLENSTYSLKIFGGEKIDQTDEIGSYLVAVTDFNTGEICSGTIISEDTILTAAHCVENSKVNHLKIVFAPSIFAPIENQNSVEKFIIHENYIKDEKQIINDLALIKMKKTIHNGYKILNLAQIKNIHENEFKEAILSGYGFSKLTFPRMGAGTVRKTTVPLLVFNADEPLVIFDQTKGQGACQGDSGGGAFVIENNQVIQIGVTSFVNTKLNQPKKADCQKKSYYSSIKFYLNWIEQNQKLLEN